MKAIKDGLITEERLASYHRLTEELIFQSKKSEIGLNRLEKEKYRKIAVYIKNIRNLRGSHKMNALRELSESPELFSRTI